MSADRDNLEEWLRDHPEANDDLADLPHLRELYQSACPPEPEEVAWNSVCSRIHESIGQSGPPRPWWLLAAGSVAAAILALLLTRSLWNTLLLTPPSQGVGKGGATIAEQRLTEPFPVVDSDDVAILSIDARDVVALVVGEPPVGNDLEFARPEDVRVIRCDRCPFSGKSARPEQGEEVLMFVAAVEPVNDD